MALPLTDFKFMLETEFLSSNFTTKDNIKGHFNTLFVNAPAIDDSEI